MNRKISVIIVTWNALDYLQTYLPSVTKSDYEPFEILIADNASTDHSTDWIRKNHPECNVVTFTKNYGYCGGNNRATDHTSGDILVFLNNDVRVETDWLQKIERCFDDPGVAVVQPKIRSDREPRQFEYAGAAGGYIDKMGYPFCRGRIFDHIEWDKGQYDQEISIFWASGAALAIRRDVFNEVGRFDENFQFHMEEIDLCWRCLNRGYQIKFCPTSTVYHLGGGSLPMDSPRKTFYNFRNSLQMIWKNATTDWLKKRFFLRLCLDTIAGIRALWKGNLQQTISIIKAHFSFYLLWYRVHQNRKYLEPLRTLEKEPDEIKPVYILYEYFIRGKKTYSELFENESENKMKNSEEKTQL
ncbi:MAG: glycosyltransferase family 2 protein [Balneolaceae bacterium]